MKDHQHPFFRPLWRRIAVVVVCLSWAALEFYHGARTWGLIALACAAYGAWQYLWLYRPGPDEPSDPTRSGQ